MNLNSLAKRAEKYTKCIMSLEEHLFASDTARILDWLQYPVTEYFSHNPV